MHVNSVDPEDHSDDAGDAHSHTDFVQSLARGVAVIRAFDAHHATLSLSDVARRADIPRAAARRFLRTLETLGYVRAKDKVFFLTPRVLELGHSYLSSQSFPEIMQPHLETAALQLGESVSGAVLDGADIVYVARVPAKRIMSVNITIGTRFPAHATSLGRALLADLPAAELKELFTQNPPNKLTSQTVTSLPELERVLETVRQQGWALVSEELELGLRSIAVPVRDKHGRVSAAINCSLPSSESIERLQHEFAPKLLQAAAAIEAELRLI